MSRLEPRQHLLYDRHGALNLFRRNDERGSQADNRVFVQGPTQDETPGKAVLHKLLRQLRGREVQADQQAASPYGSTPAGLDQGFQPATKLRSFILGLAVRGRPEGARRGRPDPRHSTPDAHRMS